ncbi:DJ-1/PfpI family protein [Streptomyces sp. NPDC002454]
MNHPPARGRRGVLRTAAAVTLTTGLASTATAAAARAESAAAPPPRESLDVAVLLYDGFTALDAVGPYETLCRLPGVRVTTVAAQRGPVRTDTGQLGLVAQRSLRELPRAEVLVVPGGGERGTVATMRDARVLEWIRGVHRHSRWTTSVCTGSLILGAAGLLRGLPATTYWASRDYLKEVGAVYAPGRFVTAGKVITAAGVSAGIDMALHLAALLSGEQVARAVQLAVEYDPEPPFDSGSPEKADAATRALALKLIADAAR